MRLRSLVNITGLLVCLSIICVPAVITTGCGRDSALYEIEERDAQDTGDMSADEGGTDVSVTVVEEYLPETERGVLIVHLCGAVKNPGVYELDIDSRIIDGINEAGGFTEDASEDALNLAMELTDGSRIYVPTKEEAAEAADGTYAEAVSYGMAAEAADDRVNINTAGADALTTLPGIGESRAKSIIAYREEHGGFKSTEEIMNVSGIGKASYEKLKDDITI